MARGELPDPAALRLPIPAEIDGASFTDTTAHLVTRRAGRSWIALRLRRDHTSDPRSDAGLVRALRLLSGRWREQLPLRPVPLPRRHSAPVRTPSGGPVLVLGATRFQPQAAEVVELQGGIELRGVWRSARGGTVAGSWRYRASATGVELRSACPAGAQLELTTWFPRRGGFRHDGGLLERAGYALRVAPRPKVRALTSLYANSIQPGLRAYRVVRACTQPTLTATWSGGAVTPLDPPAPG